MIRYAVVALAAGCVAEPPPPACTPPHPLAMVNSSDWDEMSPWLSDDQVDLYFTSDAAPGYQGTEWDLWRATRTSPDVDFDPPAILTATGFYSIDPFPTGDFLYFISGNHNYGSMVYGVPLPLAGPITPPYVVALPELGDYVLHPRMSADRLTIVYGHTLTTADPTAMDVWMATRKTTSEPFANAHAITASSPLRDNSPSISPDGQTIWFDTYAVDPTNAHPRIVTAHRAGDDFVEPTPIDLATPDGFGDAAPHVLANGRTMVFATDRTSTNKTFDLWITCE